MPYTRPSAKKLHNAASRRYNARHPERKRKSALNWYHKNRNEILPKKRASGWWKKNPNQRFSAVKSNFGLTTEEFVNLVAEQCGMCKICSAFEGLWLAVDHNHTTGKIRGLLCRKCNSGLGMFKDNKQLCHQAAHYLETSC